MLTGRCHRITGVRPKMHLVAVKQIERVFFKLGIFECSGKKVHSLSLAKCANMPCSMENLTLVIITKLLRQQNKSDRQCTDIFSISHSKPGFWYQAVSLKSVVVYNIYATRL